MQLSFTEKGKSSGEFSVFYFAFIARIICNAACFCSGVSDTQLSNSSFSSGVNSTISLSAKNWAKEMPKAEHTDSRVEMEGTVFRLKMFASVDSLLSIFYRSLKWFYTVDLYG